MPRFLPTPPATLKRASDAEFIAKVRSYRPSDFLPVVAGVAGQYPRRHDFHESPGLRFTPWAMADMTRVSLAYGNEHRQERMVTVDDVFACGDLYMRFVGLGAGRNQPLDVQQYLLRTISEQMGYQGTEMNKMSRMVAILEHTTSSADLRAIRPGWDFDVFGCSFLEYVSVGRLLCLGTASSQGWFDLEWFDSPAATQVADTLDPEMIRRTVDAHFAIDITEFRALNAHHALKGNHRRFAFNPLLSRPVLRGLGRHLLVPVPQAVARKFGTAGVYHTALAALGQHFTADLGHLFEQYVGNQLKLIPGAQVLPEIRYGPGMSAKSIDWIVILPTVVLLVEAKSARPTEAIRIANDESESELKRILTVPFNQIQKTEDRIADGTTQFDAIPKDRPRIGLAVTLEAFEIANWPIIRDLYRPPMTIPSAVISAEELEFMVTVRNDDVGEMLLSHLTESEVDGNAIETMLAGRDMVPNSIINAAWEAYPWPDQSIAPGQNLKGRYQS